MFVVGTAGHVDHGKSTLIHRITGIDPDRLAEEKARGLTIDLGFAWTTLPSGREIGIVDVPGHERFIHNMLAGAGQVDVTLFVVDANEGWRPQSEEHLAILELVGARAAVVALTKADVARDIGAAEKEVRSRLEGTGFADAPIVPVSAVTGDGLDALLHSLDLALDRAGEPNETGRPRVFVDRSFAVKGAGTVVTGTLTGGALRAGDEIELLPQGMRARIRGIQTHQKTREIAMPTSRVALNLAGVAREDARRGFAVVTPGRWLPTQVVDVELRAVRSLDAPVTERGAYVVHHGTTEARARLRLVDGPLEAGGGIALARLRLETSLVAAAGDRLVLRDSGRRSTVAGARIVDAHPIAPSLSEAARQSIRARLGKPVEELALQSLLERGVMRRRDVEPLTGVTQIAGAVEMPSFVAHPRWLERVRARVLGALERHHVASPLERGMPRERLRAEAGIRDARLFDETLAALADAVVQEGPLVRMRGHRVSLGADLDAVRQAAEGFSPPTSKELSARFGDAKVRALVEAGELVRVSRDIVLSREAVEAAKRVIAGAHASEGPLTASRIKDLLGSSRKYVIPLLEHLDAAGFTRRRGDVRDLA